MGIIIVRDNSNATTTLYRKETYLRCHDKAIEEELKGIRIRNK